VYCDPRSEWTIASGAGERRQRRHFQGADDRLEAYEVSNRPPDDGSADHVQHGGAVFLDLSGGVLGDAGACLVNGVWGVA
jgi:hypothetical protein